MNNQYGGEVIGAGGFGCVFKPQLLCKDATGRTHENGISKLLINTDINFRGKTFDYKLADKEMKDISNIMPIINNIPDNQRYFLPNKVEQFIDCSISEFNLRDIINIGKCSKILKIGQVPEPLINSLSRNKLDLNLDLNLDLLNKYKDNFRIIQQPYGGEELFKYIEELSSKLLDISNLQDINDKLQDINNKLCNLLKNGIKPMNDAKLLHHDIKSENILYDVSTNNVRLIDWGLSKNLNGLSDNQLKSIAQKCSHEYNFNTLPTNILFHFIYNSKDLDIYNYILDIFKKHRNLRYTKIPKILNTKFKSNIEIAHFLNKFILSATRTQIYEDNQIKYFKDIYAKNCDIFGFLTCYVDIIEIVNNKLDIIEDNNKILENQATKVKEHQDALIKFAKEQTKNLERLNKATSDIDDFSNEYFIWFKLKNIIKNLKELCLHYMYSKSAIEAIDVDKLNDDLVSVFNGINFEIQSGGKKILKKYKRNKGKTVKRNKIKIVKRNKRKTVKKIK
jgi:serine/threonine protein kinase